MSSTLKRPTTDWTAPEWTAKAIYTILQNITPTPQTGRGVAAAMQQWRDLTTAVGSAKDPPPAGVLGVLAGLAEGLSEWNGQTADKFKEVLQKLTDLGELVRRGSGSMTGPDPNTLCNASFALDQVMSSVPAVVAQRPDNVVIGDSWITNLNTNGLKAASQYSKLETDGDWLRYAAGVNVTFSVRRGWTIWDGFNFSPTKDLNLAEFVAALRQPNNPDHSAALDLWTQTPASAQIVESELGTFLQNKQMTILVSTASRVTSSYDVINPMVPVVPDPVNPVTPGPTPPGGVGDPRRGGWPIGSAGSDPTQAAVTGSGPHVPAGTDMLGTTGPDTIGTIGGSTAGLGPVPTDLAGVGLNGAGVLGGAGATPALFTPGSASGLGLPPGPGVPVDAVTAAAIGGLSPAGALGEAFAGTAFAGNGPAAAGAVPGTAPRQEQTLVTEGMIGARAAEAATAGEAALTGGRGSPMMFPPPVLGGGRAGAEPTDSGTAPAEADPTIWGAPGDLPPSVIGIEEKPWPKAPPPTGRRGLRRRSTTS
jgi:hypothetical protein